MTPFPPDNPWAYRLVPRGTYRYEVAEEEYPKRLLEYGYFAQTLCVACMQAFGEHGGTRPCRCNHDSRDLHTYFTPIRLTVALPEGL